MKIIKSIPNTDVLESNRLVLVDDSKKVIAIGYLSMLVLVLIISLYERFVISDNTRWFLPIGIIIITLLIIPITGQTVLVVQTDDIDWSFIFIRNIYSFNIIYRETKMKRPQVFARFVRLKHLKLGKIGFVDSNGTHVSFKLNSRDVTDIKDFCELNNLDLKIKEK